MQVRRSGTIKATEREATVAIVVVRRDDIGVIKVEVARAISTRVRATRPIIGDLAGVVQGTIAVDIPATYKTYRLY